MYLLDFLCKEMAGEKRALALKLLRDPLNCARVEMQAWLRRDLCELFSTVQSQCARDLRHSRPKLFRLKMGGLRISTTSASPDVTESDNDVLAGHIVSQLCDRIREDFWDRGERFDGLPTEAKVSLTLLYAFAELAFWLLFGVVREFDDRFLLTDDPEILSGYRLYLVGHQIARESLDADAVEHAYFLMQARKEAGSVENLVRNDPTALELLVDKTLDKCFGCHPHFVELMQPKSRDEFTAFRRRARLICYLFLHSQEELALSLQKTGHDFLATSFATGMTVASLTTLRFPKEDIEFLLELSNRSKPGEKLLESREDGRLAVGNLNLKFALVVCSQGFFDSNSPHGKWFDKGYVANYLKTRIDSSRYVALEGFSSGQKTAKYDVDAMVFDRKFRRLYFIQIKHRAKTALPYLRDELSEFCLGNSMQKAVRQLKAVREDFESEKLISKVKDKFKAGGLSPKLVDTNFLQRNSGLIILHTIENFDFGMKEGIAMYEWNTFRTLLKQETVRSVNGVCHPVRMDLGGSPLDEPAKVADALISWLDSQSRPPGAPSFAEKLRRQEGFRYDIISTRIFEVLTRWEFWRPFVSLRFPMI